MLRELLNSSDPQKTSLSRSDIRSYATANEQTRRSIELKALASEFDNDALDGWEHLDYDLNQLQRADKHYLRLTPRTPLILLSAIIGVSILLSILYMNVREESRTNYTFAAEQVRVVDEAEILSLEIQQLQEIPSGEQIKPSALKASYKQRKRVDQQKEEIAIETLPIRKAKPAETLNNEILTHQFVGPEVYLSDLKLVDYHLIDSIEINSKKLIHTGTPADLEKKIDSYGSLSWDAYRISYHDYLEETMDLFQVGKYKLTLSRLLIILHQHPDDLNAKFYSGLCYYNLGSFSDAIQQFDSCLSNKLMNFNEEAMWFKALSLHAMGDHERAKKVFKYISDQNGFYASEARKKISGKM